MSFKDKINFSFEKDESDEDRDSSRDAKSSEDEGLIDHVSERSQDSDTEQELSSEDDDRDEIQRDPLREVFMGKDGVTTWSLKPCSTNILTRPENLVYNNSSVNPFAKNAKTEIDCWKIFFTDGMLEQILYHTNAKIKKKLVDSKKSRSVTCSLKETTIDELLALFGLTYLAGLNGANRLNLRELWRTDGTGIEIFRSSMSLQRFYYLQKCIRFEDEDDKNKVLDNLAPIRTIFEQFVLNCQSAYCPSEYLTIDEKLIPFRAKCPFRQFIQNKSAKYGIKTYALVDAKKNYTINLEIYANQPVGPFLKSNDPFDVVDRLVQPVSQTYRNVSFDNWFTSIPLVSHLLNHHKLTCTGALKKNKPEIPTKFISNRGHKVNSSQFGFREGMTLVSYRPKNSKVVLVLSSLHQEPRIDPTTDEKQKPEIITFYDSTKSGAITVDELCAMYDVSRNTARWPMSVFYTLMNIAALNAVIVYRENNASNVNRRDFIRKLALQMVERHLSTRKNIGSLPREMRKRIHEQIGETMTYAPPSTSNPYRRCKDCLPRKNRKTKYACNVCNKPLCLEHVVAVCQNCIGVDSD